MIDTIRKHKDFQFDIDAPVFKSALFIAKSRPTIFDDGGRYGLIVTKRNFKLATTRNRIKRQLRVWIRLNADKMCGAQDYIFIANRSIQGIDMTRGMDTMRCALKELDQCKKSQ